MSGVEIGAIIIALIGVFGSAIGIVLKFGGDYILRRMEIKAAKQKEEEQKSNFSKLKQDIVNNSSINAICEEISSVLKAEKCVVLMFHNGGYFYTGNARQFLSIVAGISHNLVGDIRARLVNLPIGIFSRHLEKLLHVDYVHEKNELVYNDALSVLNTQENTVSSALFKIYKNKGVDWIGLLAIGWDEHIEMTEVEVEFVKSKLGELGTLLSPKLLNHN